ncbi:Vegetative incompatibility protein HET-E-1 [Colletotrichum aenigma]|uniref:Vegetative incompatibility protein HET-E-1 n=1 Tax=Colletotrichum aenigma TaxID=1215731 RepID=UPI001872EE80|nr:Vegetative incompatibility protein HET-E-1 [Colletotrichum aenigma]KAF5502529.1 Vegetative incompatibility protein HET-E-1 [Colletotrichum aenigma]
MSWAASRETKRIEDRAYSLLGIFDINMPLIYGEGHKAFRRLQEEIARETNDLSLFAWIGPSEEDQGFQVSRGVFARSPSEFGDCSKMHRYHTRTEYQPEFTLTNKGVRIDSKLYKHKTAQCVYIMYLGFTLTGTTPVCISLARTADGYVRSNPWSLDQWQPANGTNRLRDPSTIYVQKDVSPQEDLKFRSRLHRCFQVTMGLWSSMKLERVRCSPEHLWDERFATFISSNPEKSFIASMKLSVHGDDSSFGEDFPLILIFGWSKTQQRPFAVLYGDGEGVKNPKTSVKNLLPDDFPDILQNEVDWERSHDENAIENAISVVHSAPRFRAREVQFIRAVSPWGVRKTYAFVATFNLSLDTHKDPDNMVMYHISIRGRSSKLKDGNAIAKAYSFVPGTDVNVEEGT